MLTSQQNAAAATELHQTHPLLCCLHFVARQQHPDAFSTSVDAAFNPIVEAAMNAVGPNIAAHDIYMTCISHLYDAYAEPVHQAEGYGGRWDKWADWSHEYEYYDGITITIASSSINESHQKGITDVMRSVLQRETAMADDKNMRYEFREMMPILTGPSFDIHQPIDQQLHQAIVYQTTMSLQYRFDLSLMNPNLDR